MSATAPEEVASSSLPELPPQRKALRDSRFFEKCCWLSVPVLVIVITLFFFPSHLRPNLVSFNFQVWDDNVSRLPVVGILLVGKDGTSNTYDSIR
jgi:hypothetical protein